MVKPFYLSADVDGRHRRQKMYGLSFLRLRRRPFGKRHAKTVFNLFNETGIRADTAAAFAVAAPVQAPKIACGAITYICGFERSPQMRASLVINCQNENLNLNRPSWTATRRKRPDIPPYPWRSCTGADPCSAGWPSRRRRTVLQKRSDCTSDSCGC